LDASGSWDVWELRALEPPEMGAATQPTHRRITAPSAELHAPSVRGHPPAALPAYRVGLKFQTTSQPWNSRQRECSLYPRSKGLLSLCGPFEGPFRRTGFLGVPGMPGSWGPLPPLIWALLPSPRKATGSKKNTATTSKKELLDALCREAHRLPALHHR
jgi:hypothetical protein